VFVSDRRRGAVGKTHAAAPPALALGVRGLVFDRYSVTHRKATHDAERLGISLKAVWEDRKWIGKV